MTSYRRKIERLTCVPFTDTKSSRYSPSPIAVNLGAALGLDDQFKNMRPVPMTPSTTTAVTHRLRLDVFLILPSSGSLAEVTIGGKALLTYLSDDSKAFAAEETPTLQVLQGMIKYHVCEGDHHHWILYLKHSLSSRDDLSAYCRIYSYWNIEINHCSFGCAWSWGLTYEHVVEPSLRDWTRFGTTRLTPRWLRNYLQKQDACAGTFNHIYCLSYGQPECSPDSPVSKSLTEQFYSPCTKPHWPWIFVAETLVVPLIFSKFIPWQQSHISRPNRSHQQTPIN